MKKFLTKTTLISLPILVAAVILEALLRNIPNDYLYKKEYLDEHSDQIETLILGSSHFYYGLNPDYFSSNTFNASYISQSLNYDLEILKKYQSHFTKLKTIILPISYFTLFGNIESDDESWRVKNYVIYYGVDNPTSLTDYSEVLSNQLSTNIERFISYYLIHENNISCSRLGWGTSYKSKKAKDLIETGKTAAKRHTRNDIYSDEYKQTLNSNISFLNSFIQWSEKRNVKLLLVTPPAFKTYRQNISVKQLNFTTATILEIMSKHNNCTYLNLFSDKAFIAKDFYDADHLSEIGATKLSTLINDKLRLNAGTRAQMYN